MRPMAELLAQRADVLAQHLPSPRVAATVAVGFTATGLVLLVTRSRQRGRPGTAVVTTPEELQRLLWRGRAAAALASLCGAPVAAVRLPPCSLLLGALPARLLAALPALRELDLPRAGLTALPGPALGALSALTRLALAGNQLEALPPQLGALSALIDLDVSHNHLAALPEEIGDLASLQFLNAQGNRLTELPASVGRLAALRRLGLKGNMLQSLPASVGRLAALRELFITDNELEELPAEIGQLTALVKLQASFNLLKALPESLGGLASLELLRVASCEIREVPASLAALHRLAWLSLSGNPAGQAASPRKLAPPEVPISDLTLHEKLGDGASGEVFRATWAGQAVAVKLFRGDRSPDGHSRDEIALACAVNDRHLAKVLARLAQPLGLVMELFEGAPLAEKPNHESLLRCRWAAGATFRLDFVLRVALGVASALEALHYRGMAHGDVYAHNVLADGAGNVLLCDYGASFFYAKGGAVPYEGQEARAFGLLLSDLVQRLDLDFLDMESVIESQKQLLQLVQLCTTGPPERRPVFGAICRKLRAVQASAASMSRATPRSNVTSYRSALSSARSQLPSAHAVNLEQ